MALKSSWKLLAISLASVCLLAQSSGYLEIGDPQKVAGKRGASVQSKIPVTVKSGYHVNSNPASEEGLIPLTLTWTATGALEAGKVEYPKGTLEKYEFSEGKPISVYTGSFDVVANFKVKGDAPAGPGVVAGKLKYQACSNKACYPPKTIDVTVSYSVQ